MSDPEETDKSRKGDGSQPPTAGFDEAVPEPGALIGSFRIERELGRGGAGIVYLAHDTKLERSVALKSLPAEMTENSKARSRFAREARVLAALTHPNIATIYEELEGSDGNDYLVLEYVPGQTLSERIAEGPVKLAEALSIALQIAEAVAAAHEHDVIHRDLKPGNIKITPDGTVKVLDFGLAKTIGGEDPDPNGTTTEPGRILGTPAYMSPEQARGKPTDKHTDIWSFGCVLYEMLTGKNAFGGETATDILSNILQAEPDLEELPQATPGSVHSLLHRCLAKDPQRRIHDIGDAALEINEALSLPAGAAPMTVWAKSWRVAAIAGVVVMLVLGAVSVRSVLKSKTGEASEEIRLVVLPFANLGPPSDEYFAAGITDAITARLAGIHGLGVISRQSAVQYKSRERNAHAIGKDLSVEYILEGTVYRERPSDPNSKVRIIPQLVRVSDNRHIWSDILDDDMSEVFRVQSDLAERVAQALDVKLLEPERRVLMSRPTDNIEAYEHYLRGYEYFYRSVIESDVTIALQMYKKATELDPSFALAHAGLSRAHMQTYWFHYDHSEERLDLARKAVDRAIELDPDLPEAHMALGHYYYHGYLDYDHALEELEIARKSRPNDWEVLSWIGFVQRRLGKFKQALPNIRKALELDPLSSFLSKEVGSTFMLLRQYPDAERHFQRAISLSPDVPVAYAYKAWLHVLAEGDAEEAKAVLRQAKQNTDPSESELFALKSVLVDVYDRNYEGAVAKLSAWEETAFADPLWYIPKAQLYAQIHGLMGEAQQAQTYYESARDLLEARLAEQPEEARFHSALGLAYAGLGQKQRAIEEGELAVKLMPLTREAWQGSFRVRDMASIYANIGEFDAAVEQLEHLLSIPAEISIPLLQLDPEWDPLRDHPGFKQLLEGGG